MGNLLRSVDWLHRSSTRFFTKSGNVFSMMNSLRSKEKLAIEDGSVSATILPLDESTSRIAYDPAKFGIG